MSVLLVTYDLRTPGQDYSGLLSTIKSYAWARLSESSYAIDCYKSAAVIYEELRPHMDSNDNLLVIPLASPWYGYAPRDVIQWLESRLQPVYHQ